MRHARLKPASQDTWHHCFNRAVGNRDDRPFDDAADYRFCSYGAWMQTGRHPFDATLRDHLIPALPAPLQTMDPAKVRQELGRRLTAADDEDAVRGADGGTEAAAGSGAEAEPPAPAFTLSARRRVRHWVEAW